MADPLLPVPTPGSRWQHKNGGEYYVLCVTNLDNPREDQPPEVVYYHAYRHGYMYTSHDRTNKGMLSRKLSEWHQSMTHKPKPIGIM